MFENNISHNNPRIQAQSNWEIKEQNPWVSPPTVYIWRWAGVNEV